MFVPFTSPMWLRARSRDPALASATRCALAADAVQSALFVGIVVVAAWLATDPGERPGEWMFRRGM